MSYTALYRKFRPADFSDVKGQDHIVKSLKNQLSLGRVGHAYLFTGTRGTGKTTVAKIMAKAVNCENPTEDGPCNECRMCKAIAAQSSVNVVELDAASHNGVNNVREIIEAVQYSPAEGNYKVYIIDEAHMLTQEAWNALLKTLEEPPSYVMFIMATTEVHKIPITIMSRCQRYDFHRIANDTIYDRLVELCQKEGVQAEEKALHYIARCADGSLRDSLSILDQCIAFYLGEELTYDRVLEVVGAADIEIFHRMLDGIISGNIPKVIEIIEEVIINGRELTWFVNEFVWYLRNLLLTVTADRDYEDMIDMSSDNLHILKKHGENVSSEVIIRYIRILSELSNTIKFATQKRVLTEVAFIKLCKPQMEDDLVSIKERIRMLEINMREGTRVVQAAPPEENEQNEVKATGVLAQALPQDIRDVAANWGDIISSTPFDIQSLLRKMTLSYSDGDNPGLTLVSSNDGLVVILNNESSISSIKSAINSYIGKEVNLTIKSINKDEERMGVFPDIERLVNNGVEIRYE